MGPAIRMGLQPVRCIHGAETCYECQWYNGEDAIVLEARGIRPYYPARHVSNLRAVLETSLYDEDTLTIARSFGFYKSTFLRDDRMILG